MLVTGCVEHEEVCWIRADGSGRMRLTVRVAEPAGWFVESKYRGDDKFRAECTRVFEGIQGLELREAKTFREQDKVLYIVEFSFTSPAPLNALRKATPESAVVGSIDLGPVSSEGTDGTASHQQVSGQLRFRRRVQLRRKDGGIAEGVKWLASKTMGRKAWFRYETHLPFPVLNANATAVGRWGDTVTWSYSYAQMMSEEGVVMEAELRPSLWRRRWLVFAGTGLLVVLSVSVVVCFVRRRSRRRPSDAVAPGVVTGDDFF